MKIGSVKKNDGVLKKSVNANATPTLNETMSVNETWSMHEIGGMQGGKGVGLDNH